MLWLDFDGSNVHQLLLKLTLGVRFRPSGELDTDALMDRLRWLEQVSPARPPFVLSPSERLLCDDNSFLGIARNGFLCQYGAFRHTDFVTSIIFAGSPKILLEIVEALPQAIQTASLS